MKSFVKYIQKKKVLSQTENVVWNLGYFVDVAYFANNSKVI